MTTTRTVAALEISAEAFQEIKLKLKYGRDFATRKMEVNGRPAIDMADIAVTTAKPLPVLREVISPERIEVVKEFVAAQFKLTMDELLSKARPQRLTIPRQMAMWLCRSLELGTSEAVGIAFGKKDHGTVLHACKQIDDWITCDPVMKAKMNSYRIHLAARFELERFELEEKKA